MEQVGTIEAYMNVVVYLNREVISFQEDMPETEEVVSYFIKTALSVSNSVKAKEAQNMSVDEIDFIDFVIHNFEILEALLRERNYKKLISVSSRLSELMISQAYRLIEENNFKSFSDFEKRSSVSEVAHQVTCCKKLGIDFMV